MLAGASGVRGDVIPYGFAPASTPRLRLNVVGMRRRKFTKGRLHAVRQFYQDCSSDPARLRNVSLTPGQTGR